ncbi:hypothetical protein J7M28_13155 [bacterium]|nr:hypothetical protein [bacterium]
MVEETRDSFISGRYYSAAVAAVCLAERLLNDLVLRLRDYMRERTDVAPPEDKSDRARAFSNLESLRAQKKISKRDFQQIRPILEPQADIWTGESFTNWKFMCDHLKAWEVINQTTVKKFGELHEIRKLVHYRKEWRDAPKLAKTALNAFGKIVFSLFDVGKRPDIFNCFQGIFCVRKSMEKDPFVREFIIRPGYCELVGYKHNVVSAKDGSTRILDDYEYPDAEISDDEFSQLRKEYEESQLKNKD